jgi:large subunit ribosomal protein L10
MPNQKNTNTIEKLKEKVAKAKSITFVDYLGLNVNDINEFRQQMTDQEAEPVIAKNTLMRLALKEEGFESAAIDEQLKGPTAAIFSYKDPVAYLKPLYEFAKKMELPKIKFALIEGAYTDADKVETIGQLPTREQLLTQIVVGLNAPLSGFVNVIGGSQRKFVTVLSKIAEDKKEDNSKGGVS